MTGEINLPTLPPAPAAGPGPAPAAGELLKLLEPQIGLIDPGKTANAEVIALKQGGEAFQLLLKLTLEGGRQTLVHKLAGQVQRILLSGRGHIDQKTIVVFILFHCGSIHPAA